MGWQIEVCGDKFREGDISWDLFEQIEEETGLRWTAAAGYLGREAKPTRVALAVLLADRRHISIDEAKKLIGELKPAEVLKARSEYDDGLEDFPTTADTESTV